MCFLIIKFIRRYTFRESEATPRIVDKRIDVIAVEQFKMKENEGYNRWRQSQHWIRLIYSLSLSIYDSLNSSHEKFALSLTQGSLPPAETLPNPAESQNLPIGSSVAFLSRSVTRPIGCSFFFIKTHSQNLSLVSLKLADVISW